MSTFETIDDAGLALRIRDAQERVLLCAPGFGDPVSAALIEAQCRLGSERVVVIVEGTAVNAGQEPLLFAGEVAVLMHGRFSRTVPVGLTLL